MKSDFEDKINEQSISFSKENKNRSYKQLLDQIEAFIMTMLYRQLFSSDQTKDEDEDLKVQVSLLYIVLLNV